MKRKLSIIYTCITLLTSIILAPFAMAVLLSLRLFFSNLSGRFFYRLLTLVYQPLHYLCKRFMPDLLPYINEPDLDFILSTSAKFRTLIRYHVEKYISFLKQTYIDFLQHWETIESARQLILMDTDSNNPFYKDTFQFLSKYWRVFRIVPGFIVIDDNKIMHIKIQVLERIKDNLSMPELEKILQLRLINALTDSDYLINIPSGYWTEDTIYFPNLEHNLKSDTLIVLIALSKSGMNYIKSMQDKKDNTIHRDLDETL